MRAKSLADTPRREEHDSIAWAMSVLTLVEAIRGADHPGVRSLREYIDTSVAKLGQRYDPFHAVVRGAAAALASDLEFGLIPDLPTRIRSEVEGDLLAQGLRLLDEHLKDPAAMLIGAVLEDALRQLCRKHGVPEADRISIMNDALRKAGVYGLPQAQHVTAWAAIRNKADHGHFGEYTEPEVRVMHQGVSGFITAHLGA